MNTLQLANISDVTNPYRKYEYKGQALREIIMELARTFWEGTPDRMFRNSLRREAMAYTETAV